MTITNKTAHAKGDTSRRRALAIQMSVCIASAMLIFAAACDGDDGGDERIPFTAESDVEFIDAMVPHHQMALDMAMMEVAEGEDVDVKAFAQSIIDDQTAEIAELKSIREEITGSDEVKPVDDPHDEMDMAEMEEATGAELDEMFLEDMMAHHAGAIQMAHRALPNLERSDLQTIAMNIIDAQSEEIGTIRELQGD